MGFLDSFNEMTDATDDDVFMDTDIDEGCCSDASSTTAALSDSESDNRWTVTIRTDVGDELCRVRLSRWIGCGGFGNVFEGDLDSAVGGQRKRVAIKVPRRRSGCGAGTASMDSFVAESGVVRLRHPNVVSVLAAGWIEEDRARLDKCDARWAAAAADAVPAVVMEFAGQCDLQTLIDKSTTAISLRRRLK